MTQRLSRLLFPLTLGFGLLAFYWFFQLQPRRAGMMANFRETIFGTDLNGLLFAALIPLIYLAVRLLDTLAFDIALPRRRKIPAPRLLRDIVSLGLYFLLFSWASSALFKFSLGRFLTATTILAAILGLALQETLGNLFSGIALHMEDSFEVGDIIKSGDYIGVVEGLSWRATKIRVANGNNIVLLPNSVLARERLEVFPQRNLNSHLVRVGIDYNTPPATVISVLAQAASHVEGVSREIPCFARVGSFGESSVVYEIKYFTRDYDKRDRIDADVKKAVWYALRRNGISIPFPILSFQPYAPSADVQHLPADAILQRLHQVELLMPISAEAQSALVKAARVHVYSKGETIIRHGAEGNSMFVIHDGTVSVRIADDSADGMHEVAQLGPGSVFGEMALLTGETRTADVVALADVTAIEITKDALHPVLAAHPEFANAISHKVAERRLRLHELQSASSEEEELTIRSRILSFFGLRES